LLFLGHLKGRILKNVTHKAGAVEGAQAQRPIFLLLFQAWVALTLWKNRSATTGCAKTPSQSSNSILEDWVALVAIYIVSGHQGASLSLFWAGAKLEAHTYTDS
jgi:heme/copper-type cytochrome/quinol oxidase subunit 2